MAEEGDKVVENEEVVVPEGGEQEVVQTPEPTPIELEAMQEGWTPKDQWKGDPKQWRDAASWIDRGQMIRVNSSLRGEIKKLESQVAVAFKQGKELADANYAEKLAELRAIKRRALEEQDFATADQLDDKIDELKENRNKPTPVTQVPEAPPEYHKFTQRNPWYLTNSVMQHTANAIGAEFVKANPNGTPADLYFHVETQMRENFPQLGGKIGSNKALPATEAGGTTGNSRAGDGSEFTSIKKSMSSTDLDIMKTLIKTGTFKNEAEYLKEYAKLNK